MTESFNVPDKVKPSKTDRQNAQKRWHKKTTFPQPNARRACSKPLKECKKKHKLAVKNNDANHKSKIDVQLEQAEE